MPELPEVETIKRDLTGIVVDKRIEEVVILPDPRGIRALRRYPSIPGFIAKITGTRIEEINRRGKYLLFLLNSRETLLCHLGMSGQLIYRPSVSPSVYFDTVVSDEWETSFNSTFRLT